MRLEAHLRPAERVGAALQRRQVRRAWRSRRIRRRHPVVQGRTGHARHQSGRGPEEPHGKLAGPGEPERVRFRDFDLRGAPGTRQLDGDDQVPIPVGAEDQLAGLADSRLVRELRHSNRPAAQRRLRGREKERAEQVGAASYSLADRAHRGQPGATGSREMFRLRQPRRIRAGDGFRQRRDNLLSETTPVRTRGVHDDRQDCRLHPISGFDDLGPRPAKPRASAPGARAATLRSANRSERRRGKDPSARKPGSYPKHGRHDVDPARVLSLPEPG